ncbi:hypothetical protein OIU78_003407 [Salix suchowensis]|nr:hypothetical protein OIU78_003407 [Salix suchowensis]
MHNFEIFHVLGHQGYDGAAADVWSCGVILFVLMAGYLPFDEIDLTTLNRRINAAEYSCPFWFPPGAKALIDMILDPNPKTGIKKHPWFSQSYESYGHSEEEEVNLDDVRAVFDEIEDHSIAERLENSEGGLNLSALFDRRQDFVKRQTRFVSRKPAKVIISAIESVAESMNLKFHTRNYKTKLEGKSENKAGQFAAVLGVYEVAPSLFMVDARKVSGETLEYHKFYKNFCAQLENIIWKPPQGCENSSLLHT